MIHVPIEDLLGRTNSLYKLVILATKRSVELNDGSKPKVDIGKDKKLSTIALKEIAEGKIKFQESEAV